MDSQPRRFLLAWISFAALIGCIGAGARTTSEGDLHSASVTSPATDAPDGWQDWTWLTTTTATPPPTTTAPPTTVPPTTAPPATAPPTTAAAPRTPAAPRVKTPVVAAPAPAPAPAPSSGDPLAYAVGVLQQVVPARWLAAVPVRISLIDGDTSWSYDDGTMDLSVTHLSSDSIARFTLAHEWGHQVAWKYGTNAYNGAGPAGFPYAGALPEEMWADCVGVSLSGVAQHSHGLPGCSADALAFTSSWLAAGPPGR